MLVGFAVFALIGYFAIYFWGLGRTIHHFENPFSQLKRPLVAASWDSKDIWEHLGRDRDANDFVVWIDVYRNSAGELRALPSSLRPEPQDLVAHDLKDEGPVLLEVVQKWKSHPLVFSIHSNEDNIDGQFNDLIKGENLTRVLVQSEFDNVMSAIKTLQPLWLYGVSASDRVRWMTLSSVGLAPAAPLNGDVYVTPLKVRKIEALNETIVTEAHRRQMFIIAGPLAGAGDISKAKELGVDGYFVTNLEGLKSLELQR